VAPWLRRPAKGGRGPRGYMTIAGSLESDSSSLGGRRGEDRGVGWSEDSALSQKSACTQQHQAAASHVCGTHAPVGPKKLPSSKSGTLEEAPYCMSSEHAITAGSGTRPDSGTTKEMQAKNDQERMTFRAASRRTIAMGYTPSAQLKCIVTNVLWVVSSLLNHLCLGFSVFSLPALGRPVLCASLTQLGFQWDSIVETAHVQQTRHHEMKRVMRQTHSCGDKVPLASSNRR